MNNNTNKKKIILIDLDGVLNNYNGDYKEEYIPSIKNGAKEFLEKLLEKFELKIFSARQAFLVKNWLKENRLDRYITGITDHKEPAFLYIDDRCICFEGNYQSVLSRINNFSPWYK